jgi:hypothetical protein
MSMLPQFFPVASRSFLDGFISRKWRLNRRNMETISIIYHGPPERSRTAEFYTLINGDSLSAEKLLKMLTKNAELYKRTKRISYSVFFKDPAHMKHLIIVALLALAAWQVYNANKSRLDTISVLKSAVDTVQPKVQASIQFKCDGRTRCSQMTSCAEATFFLKNCPGVKMDGDNDGIPCERQWCH